MLTSILAASLFAQNETPKIEATIAQTTVAPGRPITGKVNITFADGLHAYQNPPTKDYQIPVSLSATTETIKLIRISYPQGEEHAIGGESDPSRSYSGTISIPFLIKAPMKAGSHKIALSLRYQQCTDSMCFAPKSVPINLTFKVAKTSNSIQTAAVWAKTLGTSQP
jgi:DsbC/DsbD-like thiol-disulfide interchange protein